MKEDNHYIPTEHLESQAYLYQINSWNEDNNMKINRTKTRTMLFNFTNNYQFSTRQKLKDEILQTSIEKKTIGNHYYK